MRKPHILKYSLKNSQQGFSLFVVLMVMLVIAFLVVTATQSYNTEQRISTNDADRKLAMSLAETTLRKGESEIATFEDRKDIIFSTDCTNGLCAPAGSVPSTRSGITIQEGGNTVAWERLCGRSPCIESKGKGKENTDISDVRKRPRYIIEYIGLSGGATIYRVTARAWGKNKNTVVTLQSYVSAS